MCWQQTLAAGLYYYAPPVLEMSRRGPVRAEGAALHLPMSKAVDEHFADTRYNFPFQFRMAQSYQAPALAAR